MISLATPVWSAFRRFGPFTTDLRFLYAHPFNPFSCLCFPCRTSFVALTGWFSFRDRALRREVNLDGRERWWCWRTASPLSGGTAPSRKLLVDSRFRWCCLCLLLLVLGTELPTTTSLSRAVSAGACFGVRPRTTFVSRCSTASQTVCNSPPVLVDPCAARYLDMERSENFGIPSNIVL